MSYNVICSHLTLLADISGPGDRRLWSIFVKHASIFGCSGILAMILMNILDDIEKATWWLFTFITANHSQKRTGLILSVIDALIILFCSTTFSIWVFWIFFLTFIQTDNFFFSLVTAPGLIILQELDEKMGEFLKSSGYVNLAVGSFIDYTHDQKMKVYKRTMVVRTVIIGLIYMAILAFLICFNSDQILAQIQAKIYLWNFGPGMHQLYSNIPNNYNQLQPTTVPSFSSMFSSTSSPST